MGLSSDAYPTVLIVWHGFYSAALCVIIFFCLLSFHYTYNYIPAFKRLKAVSVRNTVVSLACAIVSGALQYYTTVYPTTTSAIATYFLVSNLLLAVTTSSGLIQIANRSQFIIALVSILPIMSSVGLAYYSAENNKLALSTKRNKRHVIVGATYIGMTGLYVIIRWMYAYIFGWGEIWFGHSLQIWCDNTQNYDIANRELCITLRQQINKKVVRMWMQNSGIRSASWKWYCIIALVCFVWASLPSVYFVIFLYELKGYNAIAYPARVWSIVIAILMFVVQFLMILSAPNNLMGYTPLWANVITILTQIQFNNNDKIQTTLWKENDIHIVRSMCSDMQRPYNMQRGHLEDRLQFIFENAKQRQRNEMIVAAALIYEATLYANNETIITAIQNLHINIKNNNNLSTCTLLQKLVSIMS